MGQIVNILGFVVIESLLQLTSEGVKGKQPSMLLKQKGMALFQYFLRAH